VTLCLTGIGGSSFQTENYNDNEPNVSLKLPISASSANVWDKSNQKVPTVQLVSGNSCSWAGLSFDIVMDILSYMITVKVLLQAWHDFMSYVQRFRNSLGSAALQSWH
jgi:hypothetical protein